MSRNDSFISECYSSINEMESVVMESELDVVGSIVNAYDSLKSIDPKTIHEALYTLADAYMLVKGK